MQKMILSLVMAFLCAPSFVFSQSCSTAGTKENKYTASGCGYTTQSRTCCPMIKIWSGWDEACPACDCSPSATQSCGGGNGTQKCSSACKWESCACNAGYHMNGSTCVKDVDCSDRTYKLSHKSECCPRVSYSDSDCYTQDKYVYRSQGNVSVDTNTSCSGSALNASGTSDDKCNRYLYPIKYQYNTVSRLSAGGCANDSCSCGSSMEGSLGYTTCTNFGYSGGLNGGVCWATIDLHKCVKVKGGQKIGW